MKLFDPWMPRIHVCGDIEDLLQLAGEDFVPNARWAKKFEKPGDREVSKTLEIEVETDQEAEALAGKIQEYGDFHDFRLYDVDVPAVQMYLYNKGLFPLAYVEAEETSNGINWTLKDSREKTDYSLPRLRIAKLELSTCRRGELQNREDELAEIRFGNRIIDSGDEADKILQLSDAFREIDPDVILTRGGDSFIFPYLTRKAQSLGILGRLALGREESPVRVYNVSGHSYFSYGKILYRDTAARLFGRLHFDEKNAFVTSDCGLEGLFEVSRTCIMPLQKASRATIGTNMTSLQLYSAVTQNVLVPWRKSEAEEFKSAGELVEADRGGFVFEPAVGIFDDVGELDFASLYPSLMLKNNLSGETVKCACCPESQSRVPDIAYNICQRWNGIVPRSLDILLRKRTQYKRLKKECKGSPEADVYDRRQAALKWILVCSFGYLGFKNAKFGKIDAHIATCAFARQALRKAREIAESKGFTLLHSIVDSMWLHKQGATAEDYEELCAKIRDSMGLPVNFEAIYKWIVFLRSRVDSRLPVLNRYFGIQQDNTFKVRGIELRKHDTPKIVEDCQREMLGALSAANSSAEFRAIVPEALRVLRKYVELVKTGNVPNEDLAITKSLSKAPGEYRNLVPQAVAAQHLVREGNSVHAGQSISYVLTKERKHQPDTRAWPVGLIQKRLDVDDGKYLDLLISAARNILEPAGLDEKSIRTAVR